MALPEIESIITSGPLSGVKIYSCDLCYPHTDGEGDYNKQVRVCYRKQLESERYQQRYIPVCLDCLRKLGLEW